MNLDYEKNMAIGETLRTYIAMPNRVTKHDQKDYLKLSSDIELAALNNNLKASEVATGFINGVHFQNVMSGLAPTLLDRLVDKITSKVYIEEAEENNNQLKEKFSNNKLNVILKKSFTLSLSTGRAVNVVDKYNDEVFVRTFDLFRSKLIKVNDKITEAFLYLDINKVKAMDAYFLVEHRYFNNRNIACKKYELVYARWEKEKSAANDLISYDDVEKIPNAIRQKYESMGFKLLKEYQLEGFDNTLGVFPINNTAINILYPYVDIPLSQFQFIQDLFIEYDTTRTFKEIDKHFGRGRIVRPEHMQSFGSAAIGNVKNIANINLPFNKSVNSDDLLYTTYPSTHIEENKPMSIQFDLRTEQWRNEISGLVGDICSAFGLSIVDYDPRLLQTGQRTDDEINAMTDITRSTVENKRELATESINEMLKLIAKLYGIGDSVFIRWSLSSIINPTKNNALISSQLQNGTISHEEAVKRSNPDYTSKELEEELQKIKNDKEQVQANTIATTFENF